MQGVCLWIHYVVVAAAAAVHVRWSGHGEVSCMRDESCDSPDLISSVAALPGSAVSKSGTRYGNMTLRMKNTCITMDVLATDGA